jgi:hypothetical protein
MLTMTKTAIFVLLVSCAFGAVPGWTATSSPTPACVSAGAPDADASALKGGIPDFMAKNPAGGSALVHAIRTAVSFDPDFAGSLGQSLGGINDEQAFSAGVGLGQAAVACAKSNPQAAAAIQQAVVTSNNQAALKGFSQASGNILTGSIGGGGGGVPSGGAGGALGGGFGGGSGSNNGSLLADATNASPTQSGNFLTGGPGSTGLRLHIKFGNGSARPVSPSTP